jgi:hypothetical protein
MRLLKGYKGNLIKTMNGTVDTCMIRTYNSRQSFHKEVKFNESWGYLNLCER